LTEANAINDFKNQTRIIIGGPKNAASKVRRLFVKAFPKVKIIKTDSTYAEMVKYVTNSFLATKVSFANEAYQICKKLNIDYDKVIEYAMHDDRLGYSHWSVPGPDGDFGYGGHCFPKDVKALINVAEDLGIHPHMLIATDMQNNKVRKNRDWENMEGRAVWNEDLPKNDIKIPQEQYEFFKDRLSTISLIMEGILQQHPVAKIEPKIKDHVSAAIDELYKIKQLIK